MPTDRRPCGPIRELREAGWDGTDTRLSMQKGGKRRKATVFGGHIPETIPSSNCALDNVTEEGHEKGLPGRRKCSKCGVICWKSTLFS